MVGPWTSSPVVARTGDDNILIEERCGGGKIARYQRDREGFCHNGDSYEDRHD
jgi:hypothetical protein